MEKNEQVYELIWMSRPLMQAAEQLVERNLQGTGVTVRMRAVLEILARDGSLSVPALAHRLHINRQYVQVMVNETLAEGLTHKVPNPQHRRSAMIALTEQGQQLIQRVMAAEQDSVCQMADGFSAADVAVTHSTLRALLDALQAHQKDLP